MEINNGIQIDNSFSINPSIYVQYWCFENGRLKEYTENNDI